MTTATDLISEVELNKELIRVGDKLLAPGGDWYMVTELFEGGFSAKCEWEENDFIRDKKTIRWSIYRRFNGKDVFGKKYMKFQKIHSKAKEVSIIQRIQVIYWFYVLQIGLKFTEKIHEIEVPVNYNNNYVKTEYWIKSFLK